VDVLDSGLQTQICNRVGDPLRRVYVSFLVQTQVGLFLAAELVAAALWDVNNDAPVLLDQLPHSLGFVGLLWQEKEHRDAAKEREVLGQQLVCLGYLKVRSCVGIGW